MTFTLFLGFFTVHVKGANAMAQLARGVLLLLLRFCPGIPSRAFLFSSHLAALRARTRRLKSFFSCSGSRQDIVRIIFVLLLFFSISRRHYCSEYYPYSLLFFLFLFFNVHPLFSTAIVLF
jgi:hypothetical protein